MINPELIQAADVNTSEWLAREALWAMAKSPLNVQWERWVGHPDIEDPSGVMGLVIGGNLQRAEVNLSQADLFEDGSHDKNTILGRVAEHVGKLAGGLVAINFMVATTPDEWARPYTDHINSIILEVDRPAEARGSIVELTDEATYYDMLRPAHNIVLQGPTNEDDWRIVKETVSRAASSARVSWESFLGDNPTALIVPGATPRSTGQEIEELREQFEPYAQLVTNTLQFN